MSLDLTVAVTAHTAGAALWTGAVVFFTWTVLNRALSGTLDAKLFGSVTAQLVWLSRASAVVMLLSGGHLAGNLYTVESLTASSRGHLVLTMVGLWLVLAVLVEYSGARIRSGTEDLKVREPARRARLPLYAASVSAFGLLLVAGLLAAP